MVAILVGGYVVVAAAAFVTLSALDLVVRIVKRRQKDVVFIGAGTVGWPILLTAIVWPKPV